MRSFYKILDILFLFKMRFQILIILGKVYIYWRYEIINQISIDFNSKVSFCVVTKSYVLGNKFDTDYESAIAFGKATVITDDSEKSDILLSLLHKYSAEYLKAGKNYMNKYWDKTAIIKMKIEHLSGKAHE